MRGLPRLFLIRVESKIMRKCLRGLLPPAFPGIRLSSVHTTARDGCQRINGVAGKEVLMHERAHGRDAARGILHGDRRCFS
jgi:hypothetical protein